MVLTNVLTQEPAILNCIEKLQIENSTDLSHSLERRYKELSCFTYNPLQEIFIVNTYLLFIIYYKQYKSQIIQSPVWDYEVNRALHITCQTYCYLLETLHDSLFILATEYIDSTLFLSYPP